MMGYSRTGALTVHLLCVAGLAAVYRLARTAYDWTLLTHPSQTLRLLLIVQAPIVIGSFSWLRRDPYHCSFWKAVGRGLLGLPIGALLNAFGAIVLGAPVGPKYLASTVNWSLLMSLLTFVPAVCVFGSSRTDWQQIVAHYKLIEMVDYMISLPALGAIIGAWFGAWPMPLDWEMPWQEWPICVSYGSVAGYLIGLLASSVCIHVVRIPAHVKDD